jgi:predicted RNA binding protein YcfA (HicA-like mRNA interferase family)
MSPSLPSLKPKEVLKALQRAGFYIHHQTGSHIVLKHPSQPSKRVVLPYHNKDLKKGTLQSIIKQAGLSVDEFLNYL